MLFYKKFYYFVGVLFILKNIAFYCDMYANYFYS